MTLETILAGEKNRSRYKWHPVNRFFAKHTKFGGVRAGPWARLQAAQRSLGRKAQTELRFND